MALTKVQQRILYCLGHCYNRFNSSYEHKPVKVYVSKLDFIDLVKDFVNKQERALYKNLELLEKKKLISYEDKKIKLTVKGQKAFTKIQREIDPFIEIRNFWQQEVKCGREIQTYIKK